MEIGAQFYTIRDFCQNLDDFSLSLKKIADIGYTNVQISGTCVYEPEWLKDELQKNGLKCVVTHNPPDKMLGDPKTLAENHTVFGCDNIGLGYFGFDEEKEGEAFSDFERLYRPVIDTFKKQGKYFMYHNHDHEFRKFDGKTGMERLSESFAPEDLGFILDTFWVQAGGGDPAQWLERLSGRVPCIHLKDYAYGRKMAVIGEGNINFDAVFAAAEKSGTKYMLVEQDDCNGDNPFDCLKRSFDYLRSCGF